MAERLARYLRERLDAPNLEVAGDFESMTGGFVNPIYGVHLVGAPPPFDRDLVVRVDGRGPGSTRFEHEFAVQRFAFDAGFPTPEPLVRELDAGPIGAPFILMARASGVPLIERVLPPGRTTLRAMDLLADLLASLHEISVEGFPRADDRADDYRGEIRASADGDLPELSAVARWLDDNRPDPKPLVLCHLDFHPINILVSDGLADPQVLDWENSGLGDRHLDLADSLSIMRLAPADELASRVVAPFVGLGRRGLVHHVLRRYRRRHPVDRERLHYFAVLASARRLRGALLDRPSEPGAEPTGFTSPAYIESVHRFIDRQMS